AERWLQHQVEGRECARVPYGRRTAMTRRSLVLAGLMVAALVGLVTAQEGRTLIQVPRFEVDPLWPKPLPNHWVLGSTIGLSIDANDHVWILHRPETVEDNFKAATFNPPIGTCCTPAPAVLEFDQAGNLLSHWGGPGQGYEWPQSNHGLTVD